MKKAAQIFEIERLNDILTNDQEKGHLRCCCPTWITSGVLASASNDPPRICITQRTSPG